MTTEPSSVQVEFTPEFKRNLRGLAKKYSQIRSDVQPVIDQLQAGMFIGDQIPRTNYVVFKVRVKNSDIQKGKSSGFRYHLSTHKHLKADSVRQRKRLFWTSQLENAL